MNGVTETARADTSAARAGSDSAGANPAAPEAGGRGAEAAGPKLPVQIKREMDEADWRQEDKELEEWLDDPQNKLDSTTKLNVIATFKGRRQRSASGKPSKVHAPVAVDPEDAAGTVAARSSPTAEGDPRTAEEQEQGRNLTANLPDIYVLGNKHQRIPGTIFGIQPVLGWAIADAYRTLRSRLAWIGKSRIIGGVRRFYHIYQGVRSEQEREKQERAQRKAAEKAARRNIQAVQEVTANTTSTQTANEQQTAQAPSNGTEPAAATATTTGNPATAAPQGRTQEIATTPAPPKDVRVRGIEQIAGYGINLTGSEDATDVIEKINEVIIKRNQTQGNADETPWKTAGEAGEQNRYFVDRAIDLAKQQAQTPTPAVRNTEAPT